MSGIDRRTDCRYSADGECTVRFKNRHNLMETPAWLTDLSVRGLRLAVGQPVTVGTVVMITIDGAGMKPVYGQVVHSVASPVTGNYIGVKLLDGTVPFTVFRRLIRDTVASKADNAVPACFVALGLGFPSTREEIHAAFRRLSMKAHPDHGGDDKQFVALYAAYQEAIKLCK